MRKVWMLPSEKDFAACNDEWLFNLLAGVDSKMRVRIIFLLWRAWHHRNNVVHGDGKASVNASVSFLQSYVSSLKGINQKVDTKGKAPLVPIHASRAREENQTSQWEKPPHDCVKVNVDAGWDPHTGRTGIGIIARNHQGEAVWSSWSTIADCASAEEAELLPPSLL
jgi:hypothetical protein